MTFLESCRDKLPLMVAIPDFRRSADMSLRTTSKPASAATCAMPLPIWPEPITPTLLIIAILPSHRNDAPRRPVPLHEHRSKHVHPVTYLLLSQNRSPRPSKYATVCVPVTSRACRSPQSGPGPPDTDPRPGHNPQPG